MALCFTSLHGWLARVPAATADLVVRRGIERFHDHRRLLLRFCPDCERAGWFSLSRAALLSGGHGCVRIFISAFQRIALGNLSAGKSRQFVSYSHGMRCFFNKTFARN
jgi:hypothetical protein